MRIRRIARAGELVALAPTWRRLVAASSRPSVTMGPDWVLPWWETFAAPTNLSLSCLAAEQEGELIGLALFSRQLRQYRGLLPMRTLATLLTGEPTADEIHTEYVGLIARRGHEEAFGQAVAESIKARVLGGFDQLSCARVDASDGATASLFERLEQRGYRVTRQISDTCSYIELPSSFDAYLAGLKKSYRYSIRLAQSELAAWAGDRKVELLQAKDGPSLAKGWEIFRRLHGLRWRDVRPQGLFASHLFSRFHGQVVRGLLDQGQLELSWLEVGGDPVAALYNVTMEGRVQVYQTGRVVDDLPKRLSLGTAMHAMAIARAIEVGHREYDFLGGQSLYKRQLSTAQRRLIDYRAEGLGPRAQLLRQGTQLLDSAIELGRPLLRGQAPDGATEAESGPTVRPD